MCDILECGAIDAMAVVASPRWSRGDVSSSRPRAREVIRTALGICRRRAGILAVVGLVLFGPLAAIEAFAVGIVHGGIERGEPLLYVGTYLWISLLMFGSALCAGLLDTLVGREFGEEDVGLRRAVRTLPYGRLVGVDLAQALVIGTASLLGFVPGLVAFTLTCLAGSLVMIERVPARLALRRSLQLTGRRFGLTLLVVTLPVAVEHQILHALGVHLELSFLALWAMHAAAAILVLVPVVVVEITLAHQLLRSEDGRART